MSQFTELPLGACKLTFDGTDLGDTSENTIFRYSEDHAPINVAQQGTTIIDEILVGHTCELETELTRTQIAAIAALLAGADNSDSSGDDIIIQNIIGKSLYENAKKLVATPVVGANVASTNDFGRIIIYKAHPKSDMEVNYNNSDQKVFKFTFTGYPDQGVGNDYRIWGNKD